MVWAAPRLWIHSLQILSGSWKHGKYNGLGGAPTLDSLTADPLWELEAWKIQWFGRRPDFGFTHCRSSLGAGSMENTMVCAAPRLWIHSLQILSGSWKHGKYDGLRGAPTLDSLTADPLWELE